MQDRNVIKCKLYCTSNVDHLSQLYTGFGRLAQRGLVEVKYLRSDEYKVNGKQLLIAKINDALTLAYDTADHDRIYDFALEECDLYFKRSFLGAHQTISKNILPLGLNYAVYGGSDGAWKRACWAFRENGTSSLGEKIRGVIDTSRLLSYLANDKSSGRNLLDIEAFEGLPRREKNPLILFLCRTWDPAENGRLAPDRLAERHLINSTRASCIRGLQKEFGPSFIGGFAPNRYSRENFSDCVVDSNLTVKSEYLKLVRRAGICISTMGLDHSNGWKLGEYVANAKAIVSETIHYEVTGDFKEGHNFLSFDTAGQCVENAVRLFENPDESLRIKLNNYNYYHQYLRPDMLVWNTLQMGLNGL